MQNNQPSGSVRRPPSPAQVASNQRNAQRSTGPRTPAGKRRSRANALTHGVTADQIDAVPRGLFAEDPAQEQAYIAGIVESLAPRDAIERVQALMVAKRYRQARRLDRLEAVSLGAAGTVAPEEHHWILNERRGLEHDEQCLDQLEALLGSGTPPSDLDYEALAKYVERRRALGVGRRIWADHPLQSPKDWEWACQAILEHAFGPGYPGAATWMRDEQLQCDCRRGALDGRALATASERLLGTVDRLTTYQARTVRALERALRDYRHLQARVLGPPPRDANARRSYKIVGIPELSEKRTQTPGHHPPR
jgi:hypothetical protein